MRGRPLHVEVDRGVAADLGIGAGDRVYAVADPVDDVVALLAVRRRGHRGLDVRLAVAGHGLGRLGDAGYAVNRALDVGGLRRVGDDDHGSAGSGREVPGQNLLTDDGVDLVAERLGVGEAGGVEVDDAERHHAERERRTDPHPAGMPADLAADPRPEPGDRRLDRAEAGPLRPEHPTSADDEQRGKQREHREERDCDADRGDRTKALGRVHLREQQQEHADRDRARARDQRGPGAVQRQCHRLVPVLVPAQLLAVSRDQEQRVVGAGPEDEHGEDAGALRIDGQAAVLRQQVDQCLRGGQRDTGGDDRQQPQDRASIGQQQDDDDHGECREQQRAVEALERVRGVGGEAGRTGDVQCQPVAVVTDLADAFGDLRGVIPPVLAEVERYDDLGTLAVGREDRSGDVTVDRRSEIESSVEGHAPSITFQH